MVKEDLKVIGAIAMLPVLGGAAAGLAAKIATRYGHTFILGSQSALLFGMIGAVSNSVSLALCYMILPNNASNKQIWAGHVIAPVVLFGITAAAAHLNLIATKLSLLGTLMLIGTGIIGNTVWLYGLELI